MSEWRLYYWPGFPGRGEFVRLVLEEAGVQYVDVGRLPPEQGGGPPAIIKFLKGEHGGFPMAAPPILEGPGGILLSQVGDMPVLLRGSQSVNICHFLARRFGLVSSDELQQAQALQVALTIADFVSEAHDTHHPISTSLYYEDQKEAAIQRSGYFCSLRIPKFLGYLENVLKANQAATGSSGGPWMVGTQRTYVDLMVFHLLTGLQYAFPKNMAKVAKDIPMLLELKDRVAALPNIAAYLASDRRVPFSNGVFRLYPELDILKE